MFKIQIEKSIFVLYKLIVSRNYHYYVQKYYRTNTPTYIYKFNTFFLYCKLIF